MDKKSVIGEVSILCNDVQMSEFQLEEYERAFHRSVRQVAKLYGIFECVKVFSPAEDDQEIEIKIPGFLTEMAVYVNDILLTKARTVDSRFPKNFIQVIEANTQGFTIESIAVEDTSAYYLAEINGKKLFAYGNMQKTDVITFYYRILPDVQYLEEEKGNYPSIQNNLEEEVIRETILYLCKIAAAKFTSPQDPLTEKWKRIYLVHRRTNADKDKASSQNREWITMKPFSI